MPQKFSSFSFLQCNTLGAAKKVTFVSHQLISILALGIIPTHSADKEQL
jgi:hypothetical protein